MGMMAEDEADGRPLYQRMKDDLVRRILSGEWRPGELVPSEVALAAAYEVSVGTARKAIDQLAQSGLVDRRRGRGTTIATNRAPARPFRFLRFRTDDGRRTDQSLYLECTSSRATVTEARRLGVNRGTAVAQVLRRRTAPGGGPALLERIVLREDLCPGAGRLIAQTSPISLSSFIDQNFHILIVRVDEEIRAAVADAADAEHLDVALGTPVLEVDRTALDLGGRVIEFRRVHAAPGLHYANSRS